LGGKGVPEIQYLQASTTDEQRQEVGELVEVMVRQFETAQFPFHKGGTEAGGLDQGDRTRVGRAEGRSEVR